MKINKYWDTQINHNPLYDSYLKAKTQSAKKKMLIQLMDEYPHIIEYLWNRADTCFGEHRVYLIEIHYKGESYLKIGYTKNSIEDRFGEKRYEDRNKFHLIRIIRESKLQALGAVKFEKEIKQRVHSIKTEMKMPGKGEIFDMSKRDELLHIWDVTLPKFQTLIGLKSPN
jgi:hypothetical protein